MLLREWAQTGPLASGHGLLKRVDIGFGEESIAELCRREGIASSMYYGWSKEFLDVGKRRLAGDTARAATSDEETELRRGAQALQKAVAELILENRLLSVHATIRDWPDVQLGARGTRTIFNCHEQSCLVIAQCIGAIAYRTQPQHLRAEKHTSGLLRVRFYGQTVVAIASR